MKQDEQPDITSKAISSSQVMPESTGKSTGHRSVLIDGVLLLYLLPTWRKNAETIAEHVSAFERHSGFQVWPLNIADGFPNRLDDLRFRVVVFHYSLPLGLKGTGFSHYLEQCADSYKIAFFQDEYHFNPRRYEFLNRHQIDCVYTLVEPEYYSETYGKHTTVPKVLHTIPGYVSDELIAAAKRYSLPDEEREFDLRYRGRILPFYMGKGAQEKHQIANEFGKRARGSRLRLDLETQEKHRIYGDNWYKFMANTRGVLGVEAGVSVFDPTGQVEEEFGSIVEQEPDITFDEASRRLLAPWEDQIYYRTISPRHFEAAAFRVCQVLFEGKYSGIMEPMVHYIPLKKDFSNFDEVVGLFNDRATREEITENAYRDLIASGLYSYRTFIRGFDEELAASGLQSEISAQRVEEVTKRLKAGSLLRRIRVISCILLVYPYPGQNSEFPGRKQLSKVKHYLLRRLRG